jgi:FtsP/CotA-like multicopper oxidase with cupredoxin domain
MINSRRDLPKFPHFNPKILLGLLVFTLAQICAFAQTPVAPVANPCPRFAAGSVIHNPPSLFSSNGVLNVRFSYQTRTDSAGRTLFCFMTPNGTENPTLYVRPGDTLNVTVTNNTPATAIQMMVNSPNCGASAMTGSSMNIHYHGTNTAPTCHSDEVIKTLINSGQTFQYTLAFPTNEPPGLYWYHPHVHGIAEAALQGGAIGLIVVEGLHNIQPAVTGLRNRLLIIGDQHTVQGLVPGGAVPSWDLTVNSIAIDSNTDANGNTTFTPARLHMKAGEKQLWRVSNSSADSILDLQLLFDGVPQNLQIVALDGVPTGSQDGTRQGKIVNATHTLIPTAGRTEFIVSAPPSTVHLAQLITQNINTGPIGDNDPTRPIATIQLIGSTTSDPDHDADTDEFMPSTTGSTWAQRFEGIIGATPAIHRTLYFSEVLSDPTNPLSPTNFFITVDGATPVLFDANNPPSIVTKQGSVEQWTIQNRAGENHEFHFHQIHFLVQSETNFVANGTPVNTQEIGQFRDMVQVPFYNGAVDSRGNPLYPSVTALFSFVGPDIGNFVYHCHILGHEDNGMMAIIQVTP